MQLNFSFTKILKTRREAIRIYGFMRLTGNGIYVSGKKEAKETDKKHVITLRRILNTIFYLLLLRNYFVLNRNKYQLKIFIRRDVLNIFFSEI